MTFYKKLSKYYDIVFKTGQAQLDLIQSHVQAGVEYLT